WLTAVALLAGALTFGLWLVLSDAGLQFALERAVTVMVIACPHALGLAVPLVVAVSTAIAARHGLLVRDRAAFQRARDVDAVLFAKPGPLTEGRFGVTGVLVTGPYDRAALLRLVASVEAHSQHPIARGIAAEAPDPAPVEDFASLPGKGVRGRVDG